MPATLASQFRQANSASIRVTGSPRSRRRLSGPFVLVQAGNRLAALPLADSGAFRRLVGAAALPYQLGRATTYAGLGAAVASGFGSLVPVAAAPAIAAAALLATAAIILLQAHVGGWGPHASRLPHLIGGLAAPLIGRPLGWTGYALGVVLGLLPCGVVYAALMVAASTGHALTAALGMLAFALGTMPGLGVVGWIGQTAVAGWAWPLRHAPVILLAANAAAALAVTVR